ncbi:MAG: hypothetical protein JSR21_18305 [Proteobacteria bacterium]|nr:hypothetical protein [Pseudomonadota bacterium]
MTNANLFGTFLDAYAKSAAERRPGDPVDAVLKELKGGARDAKDLLPLVGQSAGALLDVVSKIEGAGWVARDAQGRLLLTASGQQIADLVS